MDLGNAAAVILSARSARRHKAWGVSPRIHDNNNQEPAERATDFANTDSVARSAG